MKRIEYTTKVLPIAASFESEKQLIPEDVLQLNEMGQHGWRLCAVVDNPVKQVRRYYLCREM